MANHQTVLAATHDLEVLNGLESHFNYYHFSTSPTEESPLNFSYQLQPGPCESTNALQLMEHTGYPEEILTAARISIQESSNPPKR